MVKRVNLDEKTGKLTPIPRLELKFLDMKVLQTLAKGQEMWAVTDHLGDIKALCWTRPEADHIKSLLEANPYD